MSYSPPAVLVGPPPIISSYGFLSVGPENLNVASTAAASAVFPVAKRVVYVPVYLGQAMTLTKIWWLNGATVGTNNVDCGIYNAAAGLPTSKVIASGSTLSANANVVQSVDVADTFLAPGMYFLAITLDGTTATLYRTNPNLPFEKVFGMCQETTGSFGLPTTATPIATSTAYLPVFGFATVTTI